MLRSNWSSRKRPQVEIQQKQMLPQRILSSPEVRLGAWPWKESSPGAVVSSICLVDRPKVDE